MSLYNQMPFPPHQGIPYDYAPPVVDGFVEPDPGVATPQLDPGYTAGPRFAFGGENGVPMVVFQGIKNRDQDLIYMAFVARFDPGFDGKDFVSIFLQPSPGAPSANDRRIDVFPNLSLPSPNPPPVVTSSAGAPAAPADPAGHDRIGIGYPEIRTNKPPNVMNVYKRTPGGPDKWATIAKPAGMDCKVRSEFDGVNRFWSVEVVFPNTDPGGWITLGSPFGLYFNLGIGWTDSNGINWVVQYPWPYDPANPTSTFLADPAGFSITPENWDPPSYGNGYILHQGDPNPALGVSFVGDAMGIGVLDGGGNIGGSVNMGVGTTNTMVARLQNTSPDTAPKVRARFRIAEFGIGGLYSGGAGWDDLPTPTTNPAPHAGLDLAGAGTQHDFTLPWTISQADHDKFAPLSTDQCLWVQLDTLATVPAPPPGQPAPAGAAVPFVEDSVRRNLWITNLSTVQHIAVVDSSHLDLQHLIDNTHQVILQVATTAVTAPRQTPVEKALRTIGVAHTSFVPGMRVKAAAPVAPMTMRAAGNTSQAVDVPHLYENPIANGVVARAPIWRGGGSIGLRQIATWFSTVNAYQVLGGRTLTFANGEQARIAAHVGSYGYLAQHVVGLTESIGTLQLDHQLTGANLTSIGNNLYQATLAPKTKIQLTNTLTSKPVVRFRGPLVTLTRPLNVVANVARPIAALGGGLLSRLGLGG